VALVIGVVSRITPISIVEVTDLANSHKTLVKMDKISSVVTRLLITWVDHVGIYHFLTLCLHSSCYNLIFHILLWLLVFCSLCCTPSFHACCFLHTLFLHFEPTLVNHALFQLITLFYLSFSNYSMIIWALFLLLMIYSFCWYFASFWHYANRRSFSNKCMSSFNLWSLRKYFFPLKKFCLLVFVFVNVFMVLIYFDLFFVHSSMHACFGLCMCMYKIVRILNQLWKFESICESLEIMVFWAFEEPQR